ncbi:class I SAM-dependent methyltransferase [Cupriavidus nantongensis]|uniref:class I SAM-dependent methyltransferase n=1 Tax=Cupriavidus nantongensis TaxID=1796606 RepID=UPI0009EEF515|nr:class I SAM-dependent methyltransferase [Cupriavidus nantongensis]
MQKLERVREYVAAAADLAWRPGVPNTALDLGCGSEGVPFYLLRRGWHVIAVDRDPRALARLRLRKKSRNDEALSIVCEDFSTMIFPSVSLIHAGYALHHACPERFGELWSKISVALSPDGVFAGHFFGECDQFAEDDRFSVFPFEVLVKLFADWKIEHWDEFQGYGHRDPSRWWHFFTIVARKQEASV